MLYKPGGFHAFSKCHLKMMRRWFGSFDLFPSAFRKSQVLSFKIKRKDLPFAKLDNLNKDGGEETLTVEDMKKACRLTLDSLDEHEKFKQLTQEEKKEWEQVKNTVCKDWEEFMQIIESKTCNIICLKEEERAKFFRDELNRYLDEKQRNNS